MKQYINKTTVVAQANIEITNLRIAEKEGFLTEYGRGMLEGLEGIVDFINTLEVKELEVTPNTDINELIDRLNVQVNNHTGVFNMKFEDF